MYRDRGLIVKGQWVNCKGTVGLIVKGQWAKCTGTVG